MDRHVETLHEIGSLVAAADPLHEVLERVVELIASVIPCDACIIYTLESNIRWSPRNWSYARRWCRIREL